MEVSSSSALSCGSEALTANSQEPCQTLTSTQRGQISEKAVHYLHIAQMYDLEFSYPVILLPTKYDKTKSDIPSTQRVKTSTKGELWFRSNQNLITSSFYHPGPLYKISLQSVHAFWVMWLEDKQTNVTENITSLLDVQWMVNSSFWVWWTELAFNESGFFLGRCDTLHLMEEVDKMAPDLLHIPADNWWYYCLSCVYVFHFLLLWQTFPWLTFA